MFFFLLSAVLCLTGTVHASPNLRIRKSASTSSTIVGKIPDGASCTILDNGRKTNGFYRVSYGGVTGYASASYITIGGSGGGGGGSGKGASIYNKAKSKLGCAYVWGATGPNTFDCSGLVQWAHKQCGISIPRVSKDQARGGRAGSKAKGDVVAFGNPVHHVGICDGAGKYIHAPQTGDVVKISSLSGRRDYACCRRYW